MFQISSIDVERLQTAYMEWSFAQHETKKLTAASRETCEACGTTPFSVHIDGNHKLYRYRSSNNSLRPYHHGTVIKEHGEVDGHLRKVDSIKSVGILLLLIISLLCVLGWHFFDFFISTGMGGRLGLPLEKQRVQNSFEKY